MCEVDPAATLLQLSLGGITSMTYRVANLGRSEHDLRTGSAISISAPTI